MATPQYDSIGGAYDRVAGLGLYHRVFWGVSTKAYRDFAYRARKVCAEGLLLDAGCGSMLFTADIVNQSNGRALGADISGGMLRRARGKLREARDANILAQADLLHLPFPSQAFDGVVSFHVAHVMSDLPGLLRELRRILKPGGRLFLTSVVLTGHLRDRYLYMLAKRGIMAEPRTRDELVAAVRDVFGAEPQCQLGGSMLFTETVAR